MAQTVHPERLRAFIGALAELIDSQPHEGDLIHWRGRLLGQLVNFDDSLPDQYTIVDPQHYQEFLLHADPGSAFPLVSLAGTGTPIHDHWVWGLIGMLRGAECSRDYARNDDEHLQTKGQSIPLKPGRGEALSPWSNDIHQVTNALDDRVSISI